MVKHNTILSLLHSYGIYYSPELAWVLCALVTWFAYHHVYVYMAACVMFISSFYKWMYDDWMQHVHPLHQYNDCLICWERITKRQKTARCVSCGTINHKDCVTKLDGTLLTCPACRQRHGIDTCPRWICHDTSQVLRLVLTCSVILSVTPCVYIIILPCVYIVAVLLMAHA